jgi:hypothetical protein
MTLQAWSPFQHGFFGGVFVGDRVNFPDLNVVLDELAGKYGVSPRLRREQIASCHEKIGTPCSGLRDTSFPDPAPVADLQ